MKNNLLTKTSACAVSLAILCTQTVPVLVSASADNSRSDGFISGTFKYSPHDSETDLTDTYVYNDSYFENSAYEYDTHLATMSMVLASASISSLDTTDYADKSQNLSALLDDIGFENFQTNKQYTEQPDTQTLGVACAAKEITVDGEIVTVLAVIPRSAGYEREWAGNFTVGTDGCHEGFKLATDQMIDFASEYIKENDISGNVKLWTAGYSRGSAASNLLGGMLVDNSDLLGVEILPEDIYDYDFGTPMGVTEEYNPTDEKYDCIHNVYADYDIVSYLALDKWGFNRYGTVNNLPVHNSDSKAQMLEFLKSANENVYNIYTAENSANDPDNFYPKVLQPTEGGSSVTIVNDSSDTAVTTNSLKDFWDNRFSVLSDKLIPDRETFAEYEPALTSFMEMYFGLTDSQNAELSENASKYLKITGALLYVYYAAKTYEGQYDEEVIKRLYDVILATFSEEEFERLTSGEQMSDEDEEKLEQIIEICEKETIRIDEYSELVSDLQDICKSYLEKFFTVTNENGETTTIKSAEKLVDFIAYLLFAQENDEEVVTPLNSLNLDSSQLKTAVTFYANASMYMRVHNNEIILSWVKTQDTYFTEGLPDDSSQSSSSDENSESSSDESSESSSDESSDNSSNTDDSSEQSKKPSSQQNPATGSTFSFGILAAASLFSAICCLHKRKG